jgi:hypothetical protein
VDRSERHSPKRCSVALAPVVMFLALGCDQSAPSQPAAAPTEPTWAQQAAAVRTGRSDVIRLDHTLLRDDDLVQLDDLKPNLRRVNLSRTQLSDRGLARLCELHGLEQLRLSSPRVTDAGMAHVAKLRQLRFLHLLDMPISDLGLDQLHGLENLESLYLDRTNVTDDGLARLIQALPNVHLHIDEHHHSLDPHAAEHSH